jgi:hypothetical protein
LCYSSSRRATSESIRASSAVALSLMYSAAGVISDLALRILTDCGGVGPLQSLIFRSQTVAFAALHGLSFSQSERPSELPFLPGYTFGGAPGKSLQNKPASSAFAVRAMARSCALRFKPNPCCEMLVRMLLLRRVAAGLGVLLNQLVVESLDSVFVRGLNELLIRRTGNSARTGNSVSFLTTIRRVSHRLFRYD